jgi:hypothetical protein
MYPEETKETFVKARDVTLSKYLKEVTRPAFSSFNATHIPLLNKSWHLIENALKSKYDKWFFNNGRA